MFPWSRCFLQKRFRFRSVLRLQPNLSAELVVSINSQVSDLWHIGWIRHWQAWLGQAKQEPPGQRRSAELEVRAGFWLDILDCPHQSQCILLTVALLLLVRRETGLVSLIIIIPQFISCWGYRLLCLIHLLHPFHSKWNYNIADLIQPSLFLVPLFWGESYCICNELWWLVCLCVIQAVWRA